MKLSLQLLQQTNNNNNNNNYQTPILFKAKLPLTILNQPFLSTITTSSNTSNPNTSFSLSTNFPSYPSLSLSYNPSSVTSVTPFSLFIKSGLGLFGSPKHSPLIFTAQFSSLSNFAPAFTLHFKPQFGHFSLRKTASSPDFKPGIQSNSGSSFSSGNAVVSEMPLDSKSKSGNGLEGSSSWEELRLEPFSVAPGNSGLSGFRKDREGNENAGMRLNDGLSGLRRDYRGFDDVCGIVAMVKTVLPVSKRLAVKLRWGVNYYSGDSRGKMPYLVVNKIGMERRVEEVKEVRKSDGSDGEGDRELLKGMWFSMRRDMELLEEENRELKDNLEEMRRSNVSGKNVYQKSDSVISEADRSSAEFERWRSKKGNGEENGRKDLKKSPNNTGDVESELQKAIRAASAK